MNNVTAPLPLVIDLDGTLIHTDLLQESALQLLRHRPLSAFGLPLWLMRGKAALKQEIADRTNIDVSCLPYNAPLLQWLHNQREAGRRLVLATASNIKFAQAVADHLGIFDAVWASDATTSLGGEAKRARLVAEFGERGYCYAGNATPDLKVWRDAAAAVVVNASASLLKRANALTTVEHVEPRPSAQLKAWSKGLRLHQWLKNLLVFLPLLASHRLMDIHLWVATIVGFFAFGLTASSVYILNDLLDLEDDRHHRSKRNRPFAAGKLSVLHGVAAIPLLIAGALALSVPLGWRFAGVLGGYYVLTLLYSALLKRVVMLDVIVLASLYTVRIVAGAVASHVQPSFWLLAFSMFIFLSLALLKRYAELIALRNSGELKKARGRGYHTEDIELLASLGGSAGYGSVLVLALYINSNAVVGLYREPRFIWFACPLLLFWVSRAWIVAHRGAMHDDPIVYALRDRASRWVALGMALVFWLAI
jgi:4-hydroxybenzoate polyprenyltransferase